MVWMSAAQSPMGIVWLQLQTIMWPNFTSVGFTEKRKKAKRKMDLITHRKYKASKPFWFSILFSLISIPLFSLPAFIFCGMTGENVGLTRFCG